MPEISIPPPDDRTPAFLAHSTLFSPRFSKHKTVKCYGNNGSCRRQSCPFHNNASVRLNHSPFSFSYGVVPRGLLTFLGILYKEVAKTTSGALLYHFERQTARKKKMSSFEKHCVLDLECRILSQKPSHSFILNFNAKFHGK